MGEVTCRTELKEYCLRRLGQGVIDINVSDQQLEDRIDDAIQYFNEWHYDGCEKLYLKQQLTASKLFLDSAVPVDSYKRGEIVYGEQSGARATVHKQSDSEYIEVWKMSGDFIGGENLIGETTSVTFALKMENFLDLGILDKRYVDIPHHVMSVTKIFQISSLVSANYMFDPVYYYVYDMIWNFGGMDLISYDLLKQRLNQINDTFTGKKPIRFNRHMEKLFIDMDWLRQVSPDYYIIIECYRILNPDEYCSVWDNFFLKAYTTALFKIQWGNNLSKFAAIQLPGGVTLDGPRILEEGKAEKVDLEEQMKTGRWSEPIPFFVG